MCSCDQSLVTLAFLWEKLPQPQFYKDLTRKTASFEGWSWFKFNNLGLALDTNFKFCSGVEKKLELEVRKFWGPNPTFVEVTRENLVGGPFCSPSIPSPPILNRVKKCFKESRTPLFWTIFMDYDFCGYLCIYLFTEAYLEHSQVFRWRICENC